MYVGLPPVSGGYPGTLLGIVVDQVSEHNSTVCLVQLSRQYVIRGTTTGMRTRMAMAPSPVLAVAERV